MNILELNHVYKDYNLENKSIFNALYDINISFEKGELVSIVGESGSGKSTLMNLIGGLDSQYTGEIKIGGANLKSFKQTELDDYRKKKIGFVFQSFNLIPHLSVLDNVTIGLTLSNERENIKNKKAIELLEKLGLKDQIKKKPTQLSGGQKQRVAIARALINDPDIILADEPTGALDSTTSCQILNILKEIADDGKLVIMVTHSEKVAKISSRIVEISDGRIIKDEKNKDYIPFTKDNSLIDMQLSKETKKGHISLLSALKLSIHNMLSSKIKNVLMAIGVSISLISLILMLSFGAGLTGYISDQAAMFSDPKIATITKRSHSSLLSPQTFSNEEITKLVIEINDYLKNHNSDFEVKSKIDNENDYNVSYGFNMLTGFGEADTSFAKISYLPEIIEGEEEPEPILSTIYYSYTTPPYYNEKNLITSNSRICGDGEIMLSAAAGKALGINNLEDIVGKKVELIIDFPQYDVPISTEVTISGIVDVSLFSNFLVMYIDYDFLAKRVSVSSEHTLTPSTLYIKTNNVKTTKLINNYLATRADLAGSLEEKLINTFNEMLETFSLALAILGGISVIVALIMILVVLYMSVLERTREIGVLKSIGARKKDIQLIFSTESFLVGVISGIAGIIFTLIIGGILTLIFNSLIGFAPLRMMWYYFAEAFAISVVISVLAGLYPSAKAARLDPVEALRHE